MARRGRHRRGGRVTPKGTRPLNASPGRRRDHPRPADVPPVEDAVGVDADDLDDPDDVDLVAGVRRALVADHPLDLLAEVSTLLAVVDPRQQNPFERDAEPAVPSREQLVRSFMDVDLPETSGLLAVWAELDDDELQRARIQRELRNRQHPLPVWVGGLAATEVYRAVEQVHVLGDGDNVILGTRIGDRIVDRHELTVVVYIDHNLGTVVKDAFVVPEPIGDLLRFMQDKVDDPDTSWSDLSLADARARIADAVDVGARSWPPFETETWPHCRPIVEWLVRLLPEGGKGYERPEWHDDQLAQLAGRFFSSPFGAGLDDPDHRDLLDSILWFGSGYGPGDPLRWSPVAVEILLTDWIPRKIVADAGHLAKAPQVLRGFVRFCHAQRGIRPSLTGETLDAVDRWEPDYQEAIRSPRLQGPAALLAAAGVLDPDAVDLDHEVPTYGELMLDDLRQAVGGDDALDRLDLAPLPDEPFPWDGIADDVHDRVADVVALCDGYADHVADVELRTACRRFLHRAAVGDPTVFRRGRAETAAAAVCWIVGKANDVFSPAGRRRTVKEMAEHVGTTQSTASQRAKALLRAGGFETGHYGAPALGSPDYLVAARRRRIVELRDRYRETDG